jgi:hypothetical protein
MSGFSISRAAKNFFQKKIHSPAFPCEKNRKIFSARDFFRDERFSEMRFSATRHPAIVRA